jgi:diguanylate cyclase (GGDEF)-like protein/PAS domain S-box-containing protein
MTPAPRRPVPTESAASRWAEPWLRFHGQHLFDYPPAATAAWLAIVLAGLLAGGWALWQLAAMPSESAPAVLLAVCLAALASVSVTRLPRSNYAFTVSEVFVLAALATLGPAVAVVATGVESIIATRRNSKRLSSRISSPAASMSAIWVGGQLYVMARDSLVSWGQSLEVASLAALCGTALVPFLLNTLPLMAMMALKRGEAMQPRRWVADSAGLAMVYLGSAFIAGLVHLNALRFGSVVIVISAGVALGLVVLLRMSLAHQEAERVAQEALVCGAQREAALSQQRFMAAFTHAAIGMAIVRHDGVILQVNQALCSLVARTGAELVGCPFSQLLHVGDVGLFLRQARAVLDSSEESFSMEVRALGVGGAERWVSVHCSRYEDPGGNGHCLIYQLHDITSRHVAESRLLHIAYHDGLTDLANRNCFHERLEVAVERSRLDAEQRFAVLFLDLDRFKMVNDSLGHMAGNQLLHEVAQRLRTCVRPIDLVARLGGDEFAILLETLHDPESGLRLAQRVLEVLSQPLSIHGTEVVPGASVGITFSDLGYRTVDEVLRDADLAMYEAKAGGRGRVVMFDSSMHEKVAEKLALESDLRHAIGEGQLSVHFQPLFELEPYRLSGFEALARWTHPQRGPVSPEVFIALAEESGRIEALTDWIIDHAAGQLASWRRLYPQAGPLGMHINISGRDLERTSLVDHVRQVLETHAVPASSLTLEITETTLMGRLEVALQTMGQLRELGVRFSIDDFGTGYSSLSYLSTLPIDSLKIDRSFVMGLHDKPHNVEIVRAVLNLGQSLGRRVIAEGIETPRQLSALRELGVPVGQGYLLSRPLRPEQVQDLLAVGAVLPN